MNSAMRDDPGPDGHGPIDAVVTWVDGSDPAFRSRRRRAAEALRRENPALAAISDLAFSPGRYVQHDEVRYCVRSIINHAPWMRRIYLVTDDQFPAAFDRDTLDPRIVAVSHGDLFRDLPDALPIFNSGAIEVMLSSIEGISDRFVCFNDDFFLSKPVSPTDFFRGEQPVLRGRWTALEPPIPSWLRRRVNSARLFGFDADRLFKEVHTPYAISRSVLEEVFARHPGLRERIARRRFRSPDDYYVVSLHNHFCLAEHRAVIDEVNRWLVFGSYPVHEGEQAVRDSLARIGSGRFFSTCINGLGSFVEHLPDVHAYLDAGAGPRLAFER